MSEQIEVVQTVQMLRQATARLSEASKQVLKLAKKRARSERDYRMQLSKEIMKLRSEGVQATLIPDIARGNIAELKFERDLNQELHRSAMSAIEALKVEINALQSILKIMEEV